MSLFHYQKIIHARKLSPGPFTVYRTYKKHLKIEFDGNCVYCRMPDSLSEEKSYAVEHYRPKQKFPNLETEYSNLYYSCCDCNSHKGVFWPNENQESLGIFIPNPCDYIMHDHLRLQTEGAIKPHSFAGQWTIDLLDLNAPSRIQKRHAFLTIKKKIDTAIVNLQKRHAELKEIEKIADHTNSMSVQHEIVDVENELTGLEESIKIFGV